MRGKKGQEVIDKVYGSVCEFGQPNIVIVQSHQVCHNKNYDVHGIDTQSQLVHDSW